MSLPVYMLLGPEKGRKEEFLQKLRASLPDSTQSKFYAFDDYEEELFAQLMNSDLFCPHRLVVLDAAEEIKTKEKARPLAQYIKQPSENVTLVFVSDELYINNDLMSAMDKPSESIIKFYELFENQKEQWLRDFFRRNGLGIEDGAISAIMEKVDNNISEFNAVCSQITVYVKTNPDKKTVTYDDIEEFLAHTRQETEFTLFSHIAAGRSESALECLQTLINTSDSYQISGVLASRLANYFRRLHSMEMLMKGGMSEDEALKNRYIDTERAVTMPRDKAVYKAAMHRYSLRDVRRIISMLARYDITVKEMGTLMQQTVLERCVVRIIRDKGSVRSKIEFAEL